MDNLISRIVAQTCRQPGLSTVYTELLDFGGDEVYFRALPVLTGKTFREAAMMFEDSAVIGLYAAGESRLNPPPDTVIGDGAEIVAISADDDTVVPSGLARFPIDEGVILTGTPPLAKQSTH